MKAWFIAGSLSVLLSGGLFMQAQAGANDFFGSTIGGAPDVQQGGSVVTSQTGANAPAASAPTTAVPSGDYTSDEKRMQKKYKANVRSAQALVAKGEGMMRSKNDKDAKKGKILKEIGEKRIAELKANSPFPEIATREPKKVN